MSDLFIVRSRVWKGRRGWDVYRVPQGSARQTIALNEPSWESVEQTVHQAAARVGGFPFPERRTPNTDFLSLRHEPESTWLLQRD